MHHHEFSTFWAIATGAGGQYVFSALVSSMPPYSGNNYGIKWLYAFLHAIAANWDKVHVPGSPADRAADISNGNGH